MTAGRSRGAGRAPCAGFMPMLPGFDLVREAVAEAVELAGHELRRLELLLPDHEWHEWLVDTVQAAAVAVADITDNNPFVMYELGLAHQRRRPVCLLLSDRNRHVPATVNGCAVLPYDAADPSGCVAGIARLLGVLGGPRIEVSPLADEPPEALYAEALELLDRFERATGRDLSPLDPEEFAARVRVAGARADDLAPRSGGLRAWFVLPRVIRAADEVDVLILLARWCGLRRETSVDRSVAVTR